MSLQFLQAAIPKPFTVLGLSLRPLSISHILFMREFKLAYVEGREPELQDLILACLICSHDRKGLYEFLDRVDLAKELKRLGKSLNVKKLDSTFTLFAKYLEDGMTVPDYEIPGPPTHGPIPGAPWLQRLRVALMSRLHVQPDAAFDYPYALAVCDYYTYLETEGAIHIIGESESADDMITELKKLQAEKDAAEQVVQNG